MRFLSFFFLILNLSLSSQNSEVADTCLFPENPKAVSLYQKGIDKKKYKKPDRVNYLQEAINMEPAFAQANMALGNEIIVKCKLDNLPFSSARPFFLAAVKACPKIHSQPFYYIGFSYYEDNANDSAIKYLNLFLKFISDDERKYSKDYQFEQYQSKEMIKAAKKETELKKKIVPFNPSIVKGISTPEHEYLPYLSPDESIFLFTRTMKDESKDRVYQSDRDREVFVISHRQKDGSFEQGKPMDAPFNLNSNEGGACLTIDNKHLYYTIYKMEGGAQPNADIYYSDFYDGEWGEIKKVPGINDPVFWDSQPSISADGNTLFFASDRPGGFGKVDLWKSERDPLSHQWKKPVNLGPLINTPGNEKCPFIHSDSETLYFSSDGLFGFGGLDIFLVRKNEKGAWKEPENLGTPINGPNDDAGFLVSTSGLNAFFCSENEGKVRGKGIGKYDVYTFELYKEARPEAVTFVHGKVTLPDSTVPLVATIEVKGVISHEKTSAVYDSTTGNYVAAVNINKNKGGVVITAKAPDLSFSSQKIEIVNASFEKPPPPVQMTVEKIEVGKSFVINNIYYSTGAADLKSESFVTLDEFAIYLKENPSFVIEIQGHTDNVGSVAENQTLSEARAANVCEYLKSKGIPPSKLTFKGYGSNLPVAPNTNAENRAKNRRTEFLILKK